MLSRSPAYAFPKNFTWGVSSAAPQIEGASFVDGKGESVWDRFAKKKGNILNGDKLDPACEHYRRYKGDFRLMRDLGIKHYRLSLAWPRIFPEGSGKLNQRGMDYYNRLIDTMLENGIQPWVTMFHWDLPQALEDKGGWRSRVVPEAFARYADTIVSDLGDRVKNWITVNEIRCFTVQAYGAFGKAPGGSERGQVLNQTIHNALLCHGHGVRAVREFGGKGAKCGLSDNCETVIPVTESASDVAAAHEWFAEANMAILDPIYRGSYSDSYLKACGRAKPKVEKGDFDLIGMKTDFLGLNIYAGLFVRRGADGRPEILHPSASYPRTDSPWLHLAPRALYWAPRLVADVYKVKNLYITENGCGYDDDDVKGGECLDLHRVEYLRSYLKELHHSIADGTPVRGYFVWCFLDNFEWTDGYTRRFGIVHNNFRTQRRTPKLSAHWYSSIIKANRLL
jgi:beta-glucosidase